MDKNRNRLGYKESKVGWIPEEWEDSRLGDICSMKSGETITSTDLREDGVYPCFGGNGLRGFTATFTHDGHFVLIGRQGALCGNVHRVSGKFFASEHAVVASPHISTYPSWLSETLKHKGLNRFSESSAQPGLSVSKVLKMRVPTPPLPEQKAIAEVLECWDKGIRNLELKIEKKRNVKKGLMQRLLSGKQRLKGFTDAWKTVSLGDCLDKMNNGFVYKPVDSGSISVTRIETISSGKIDYSRIGYADPSPEISKFKMIKGDILYSHINSIEHIGKVALYQEEAELYHGMNLLLLRVSKCSSEFFIYYILTSDLCRKSAQQLAKKAVSQASINTVELKKMLIPRPPLAEQRAIAEVLSAVDSEIEALEKKLALWKEQKKYLLNNLVTGTIRLPQFCLKQISAKQGKLCS
jgi:type I restriction enzyme, S subunit